MRKDEKMKVAVEEGWKLPYFLYQHVLKYLSGRSARTYVVVPGEGEEICQLYCLSSGLSVWASILYGWVQRLSIWLHHP